MKETIPIQILLETSSINSLLSTVLPAALIQPAAGRKHDCPFSVKDGHPLAKTNTNTNIEHSDRKATVLQKQL